MDVDGFVGEVHGYAKQGTGFGYTGQRGLHPILATRADTGEVLQLRLRKGSANTQRGIERFTDELITKRCMCMTTADIVYGNGDQRP